MPSENTNKNEQPSAPVESKAVSNNQTTELPQPASSSTNSKKTPAKKTAAKKTAAKKAAETKARAKKAPSKRDPNARASASNKLTPEEVADQIVAGSQKWMSGRERDILLAEEGYNLDEIRREVVKARARAQGRG